MKVGTCKAAIIGEEIEVEQQNQALALLKILQAGSRKLCPRCTWPAGAKLEKKEQVPVPFPQNPAEVPTESRSQAEAEQG